MLRESTKICDGRACQTLGGINRYDVIQQREETLGGSSSGGFHDYFKNVDEHSFREKSGN